MDNEPPYPVNLRLPPALKKALTTAANKQTRSLAGQALHYVRQGLANEGFVVEEENDSEPEHHVGGEAA